MRRRAFQSVANTFARRVVAALPQLNPPKARPIDALFSWHRRGMAHGAMVPVYLDPLWYARRNAERVFIAFLRARGGRSTTQGLKELYVAHPWLKGVVGNVRVFCSV